MAMGSVHNTSWGQYGKKLTRNLLLSRNIWDLFPSCFSLWEASKAQERRKGKPEKTAAQNSNHFFRLIPIPGALSSPLRFGSEGAFFYYYLFYFLGLWFIHKTTWTGNLCLFSFSFPFFGLEGNWVWELKWVLILFVFGSFHDTDEIPFFFLLFCNWVLEFKWVLVIFVFDSLITPLWHEISLSFGFWNSVGFDSFCLCFMHKTTSLPFSFLLFGLVQCIRLSKGYRKAMKLNRMFEFVYHKEQILIFWN